MRPTASRPRELLTEDARKVVVVRRMQLVRRHQQADRVLVEENPRANESCVRVEDERAGLSHARGERDLHGLLTNPPLPRGVHTRERFKLRLAEKLVVDCHADWDPDATGSDAAADSVSDGSVGYRKMHSRHRVRD